MPSIYDIKPRFQALLRPLVRRLAASGVTANQVTLAAALLSCATGAFLALQPASRLALLLVPAVLFLRMALNAIDGMLAREHAMKSALGAVLNELGDVIADAALYLPFALIAGISGPLIVAIVLLATISEMAGVVAVQIGAARRYDGPMGKSDRAFLFGLVSLLAGFDLPLAPWVNPLLGVVAALIALTIFNRSRRAIDDVSARSDR